MSRAKLANTAKPSGAWQESPWLVSLRARWRRRFLGGVILPVRTSNGSDLLAVLFWIERPPQPGGRADEVDEVQSLVSKGSAGAV